LIDGPATSVPRQAIAYRHLILTPYTITSLPRAAGSGAIKKAFEKAGVVEKWESSSWAKKLAARASRKVCQTLATGAKVPVYLTLPQLYTNNQDTSDFDRFQIQLAKRSRRDQIGRAYTKEKKASA
jgi:large subunit ribosomal protein L14e